MSVGLVYEGKPSDGWDDARRCSVHDAYEMFHTCAGGPGEPLGYCKAWDGLFDENRNSTCAFVDIPERSEK